MSSWVRYTPSEEAPWNWKRVVHLHRRAGFGVSWTRIEQDIQAGPVDSVNRFLQGAGAEKQSDFEELAGIIGDAAVASRNLDRLKGWWIYRMLFAPHPLQEKLTLLWHNHFATSNLKVRDIGAMRRQNEILRKNALAPLPELLQAVVKDKAMLVWLDAAANRRGRPNEKLARELMELFTLGVGNYTEND